MELNGVEKNRMEICRSHDFGPLNHQQLQEVNQPDDDPVQQQPPPPGPLHQPVWIFIGNRHTDIALYL